MKLDLVELGTASVETKQQTPNPVVQDSPIPTFRKL